MLWRVKEAEFKPTRVRAGRTTVLLQRGEFVHSLRFMGKAWGSRNSVYAHRGAHGTNPICHNRR